jgi:hypothetical protein
VSKETLSLLLFQVFSWYIAYMYALSDEADSVKCQQKKAVWVVAGYFSGSSLGGFQILATAAVILAKGSHFRRVTTFHNRDHLP